MDRFIRVNGKDFSFEEVAKALGLEVGQHLDPVQVHLCQRVDDGILVAKGAFFDNDDYPAIDLELELPPEKDSLPVVISKTEQPRVDGGYSDGYQGVRNFVYNRDGEYYMYSNVDSRADEILDRDGMEQKVMVSGSPSCDVEVYQENPWVRNMGQKNFEYRVEEPAQENVKLEVGMVGKLKDEDGIKKALRGKSFKVTRIDANGVAAGIIEGVNGIYALDMNFIESVMVPENHRDLIASLAGRIVEFMKEHDFYEFLDSLRGGDESNAVETLAKELCSIDHVSWFVKFFEEMSYDDELPQEMQSESWALMEALGELEDKLCSKFTVEVRIENAKTQSGKLSKITGSEMDFGLDL